MAKEWKKYFAQQSKRIAPDHPDRPLLEELQSRVEGYLNLDPVQRQKALLLRYAEEEAVRFNHNYIGTEHLLIAALRASVYDPKLNQWISHLPAHPKPEEQAREQVAFIVEQGTTKILHGGLTPRANKILIDTQRFAGETGESFPSMLFKTILMEGEGIGAGVFENLAKGTPLEDLLHVVDVAGIGSSQPLRAKNEAFNSFIQNLPQNKPQG